jgi:hypothetical protein
MNVLNLLSFHKDVHTNVQMDCFITTQAGAGHPYGMFQQALRELNSRFWSLAEAHYGGRELLTKVAVSDKEARSCSRALATR